MPSSSCRVLFFLSSNWFFASSVFLNFLLLLLFFFFDEVGLWVATLSSDWFEWNLFKNARIGGARLEVGNRMRFSSPRRVSVCTCLFWRRSCCALRGVALCFLYCIFSHENAEIGLCSCLLYFPRYHSRQKEIGWEGEIFLDEEKERNESWRKGESEADGTKENPLSPNARMTNAFSTCNPIHAQIQLLLRTSSFTCCFPFVSDLGCWYVTKFRLYKFSFFSRNSSQRKYRSLVVFRY